MPRLNLDIFSEKKLATGKEQTRATETIPSTHTQTDLATKACQPSASPRFIPVGFHEEHIRLLENAVHRLRSTGHWKANKSAIIRGLIDMHENDLEQVWLKQNGKGPDRESSPGQ